MDSLASSDVITDRFGRRFNNLRVSLTAACNYACTYCVPDGKRLQAAAYELTATEMIRAVELLQQTTGIDKVRITGGEPLLSPKFGDILSGVMGLGLSDVSLTTNGQLLPRWSEQIIASGMSRINVSLDTLDAAKFRDIARSGDLATVLNGIDLMLQAGLRVKVNMVPMRKVNESQIVPMLEYCRERDIELRFIELMNMGHLRSSASYQQQFFSMEEILELIGTNIRSAALTRLLTPLRYGLNWWVGDISVSSLTRVNHFAEPVRDCDCPQTATCTAVCQIATAMTFALSWANPMNWPRASLQSVLAAALLDKQDLSFKGETTVMKFIGG